MNSQEDGFCPEHSDCGACPRNEGEVGSEHLVEKARLNWLALLELTIPTPSIPALRRQGQADL